ncbi:MAG: TOBE domain-containing protein, partial [Deltaproteobacteria bacterium]|nr:TOBE domain-containing protein [Deltaproteobacteria bacterium]
VAGFIGTPAMNFIPGVLTASEMPADKKRDSDEEATVLFEAEGVTIPIPVPGPDHVLMANPRRDVILGIRPPDLSLRGAGGNHDDNVQPTTAALRAQVEVREPMGAEVYLHLNSAAGELVARVDSQSAFRAGDDVLIDIPHDHIHLFDAETQRNLLP